MIANTVVPNPAAVPNSFTLNDLRMHTSIAAEPSSFSTLTLAGLALAVVLPIGAFLWLDPLHLLTPTEANSPAPAFAPSAEPARPTEQLEIIAPLTPAPATTSVEAPIAPAHMVQAPHVPAPVVRPNTARIKPESGRNPIDKSNAIVLRASPTEKTAPPVLLTQPEEKTDAPIVMKLGDDARNAPEPVATNDQLSVTE